MKLSTEQLEDLAEYIAEKLSDEQLDKISDGLEKFFDQWMSLGTYLISVMITHIVDGDDRYAWSNVIFSGHPHFPTPNEIQAHFKMSMTDMNVKNIMVMGISKIEDRYDEPEFYHFDLKEDLKEYPEMTHTEDYIRSHKIDVNNDSAD